MLLAENTRLTTVVALLDLFLRGLSAYLSSVSPKPKPRRAVAPVQPYEEVDLKDVTARQKQEPVNYSQMQFLPSSGDVVHQKDPKVSYADVVLPRPEEPKSDESNRFSRSSSMSQVGSYENVEFQRRSASVSKPQAIPASRRK